MGPWRDALRARKSTGMLRGAGRGLREAAVRQRLQRRTWRASSAVTVCRRTCSRRPSSRPRAPSVLAKVRVVCWPRHHSASRPSRELRAAVLQAAALPLGHSGSARCRPCDSRSAAAAMLMACKCVDGRRAGAQALPAPAGGACKAAWAAARRERPALTSSTASCRASRPTATATGLRTCRERGRRRRASCCVERVASALGRCRGSTRLAPAGWVRCRKP